MAKKYKYIDKHYLRIVNQLSHDVLKYNRTLPDELIAELPDDKFFPIIFTLLHEHKAGVACEPHVRCIIMTSDNEGHRNQLILDMEMGIFDRLPEVEIPENDSEQVSAT